MRETFEQMKLVETQYKDRNFKYLGQVKDNFWIDGENKGKATTWYKSKSVFFALLVPYSEFLVRDMYIKWRFDTRIKLFSCKPFILWLKSVIVTFL